MQYNIIDNCSIKPIIHTLPTRTMCILISQANILLQDRGKASLSVPLRNWQVVKMFASCLHGLISESLLKPLQEI